MITDNQQLKNIKKMISSTIFTPSSWFEADCCFNDPTELSLKERDSKKVTNSASCDTKKEQSS